MGILRSVNKVLGLAGLELSRVGSGPRLYSYRKPDGSFDYERYKAVQTEGNKRKITQVFADEANIAVISDYIRARMTPKFGICHGTRRGVEQKWFSERLACEVIGTEISDTATQFANTIQWDFHEVKEEWLGRVDFIYSNSLDHSYDPALALDRWMSCLTPNGLCFIEHTSLHEARHSSELDPFGADFDTMPTLVAQWAQGRYAVVDLLKGAPNAKRDTNYLVLKRF